jgi:hypothetical protein
MSSENESKAAQFFKENPDLERKTRDSQEFSKWRNQFKKLEVDGETYYLRKGKPMVSGGDRLLDEYELMLEWAEETGLPVAQ